LKEENSVPKKRERGHESGGEKIPSSSGPSHLQAQRARSVMAILEHIYPNPPIPLDHTDNFTFLCAVIMSAQTTDGKVNEVSRELFRRAPDPAALAALGADRVLSIIRPLGLAPTKARNLVAMAEKLVAEHGGRVPRGFAALEALPGVGHKTASVLMAQAFGVPAFPVDTHIARLAVRWGLSPPPKPGQKESANVKAIEKDLKALFPESSWNKLHLQLIYFGREYCPAKKHEDSNCPICRVLKSPKYETDYKSMINQEGKPCRNTLDDIVRLSSPTKIAKNIVTYSNRTDELSSPEAKEYHREAGMESFVVVVNEDNNGNIGIGSKKRRRKIRVENDVEKREVVVDEEGTGSNTHGGSTTTQSSIAGGDDDGLAEREAIHQEGNNMATTSIVGKVLRRQEQASSPVQTRKQRRGRRQ